LADQKAVVRAGVDVLLHTVAAQKIDEELVSIIREKKPYWVPLIGLGDKTEVCDGDPFVTQTLPAKLVAEIRATTVVRPLEATCGQLPPNAATREENLRNNFPKMIAAGARLVLGTDAGISAGYTFGSAEYHELGRWVQFGLPPSQAIVAATSKAAEVMGLTDTGSLAPGHRADFIVLDANPLEDIANTRHMDRVYLSGVQLDRTSLLERWSSRK
jgi:imidazolonepropionase-like amidohydrolase